jgi:Inosine-uridine preferring nucleoside hydrolase
MNQRPSLSQSPRCRVIVDNDFSGDPDGLVGLAHHLLSPTNRVVAITSSFVTKFPVPAPLAEDGAVAARELLDVVGGSQHIPVHAGSEEPFGNGSASAAADAIVKEARRDDGLPLHVACGGPLTNVAQALQQAPDIADRLTLVWIGGALDPDAFEYNRDGDPAAAALVFAQRELDIHQFPLEAYRQCAYSFAELEHDIGGAGALGQWLWSHFAGPHPDWVQIGGVWPLGDSPPVLVTALDVESSRYEITVADGDGAGRRTYTSVDFRLLVGDLLAKLRMHNQEA